MNTIEILTLITLIILTIGLAVAALQLLHLKNEIKASHDWNRRVTTLQFFFFDENRTQEIWKRHKEHLNEYILNKKPIEIEKINTLKENDYPEIIEDIHHLLGKFETLAVGLKNKVADEVMCKDHMKSILINYYDMYSPYISKFRSDRNNNAVYENFEFYSEKWKDNKPVVEREATG